MSCQFCEALYFKNLAYKSFPDLFYEINVAIVDRSWTKEKGRRRASRLTDYRNQGIGYKLNFCPECGRKIQKKEVKHDHDHSGRDRLPE